MLWAGRSLLLSGAGEVLPSFWVNASVFHISLYIVFVTQQWTTMRSGAGLQFCVECLGFCCPAFC